MDCRSIPSITAVQKHKSSVMTALARSPLSVVTLVIAPSPLFWFPLRRRMHVSSTNHRVSSIREQAMCPLSDPDELRSRAWFDGLVVVHGLLDRMAGVAEESASRHCRAVDKAAGPWLQWETNSGCCC